MPRTILLSPAPMPRRRVRDRREKFNRIFMGGGLSGQPEHQAPHRSSQTSTQAPPPPQSVPPPTQPVPPSTQSVPPPTQSVPPPTQTVPPPTQTVPPPTHPVPPRVLRLANVGNTCYAIATIQVLSTTGLHSQLLAGQTPVEMNLTNLLLPILNGTTPHTDLVPLVMALNMCLPPQNMFNVGQQQCAGEFLSRMHSSLNIRPHFSTFLAEATCPICNSSQTSNLPTSTTPFLLVIPLPSTPVPADLLQLVTGTLAQQGNFMACQNVSCPAQMTPVPCRTLFSEQAVSIYWLGRNISQGGVAIKSLTPVQDPGQGNWNGMQCTGVLAHAGQVPGGGHWIAFVRHNTNWWRVDSSHAAPSLEDPFLHQMTDSNNLRGGYTIDIVFFS